MHHRRLDTFSSRGADVAVGMMDRWRVNLLGRFELRSPDGQETALGARKSVALLALVGAAPGQRIARDRLATFLWDDMPDAQARGNLRQLLAATRRPAPFLEADGGTIGFSEGMVDTDLAAFEAAIRIQPRRSSTRPHSTGPICSRGFRSVIEVSMNG